MGGLGYHSSSSSLGHSRLYAKDRVRGHGGRVSQVTPLSSLEILPEQFPSEEGYTGSQDLVNRERNSGHIWEGRLEARATGGVGWGAGSIRVQALEYSTGTFPQRLDYLLEPSVATL